MDVSSWHSPAVLTAPYFHLFVIYCGHVPVKEHTQKTINKEKTRQEGEQTESSAGSSVRRALQLERERGHSTGAQH